MRAQVCPKCGDDQSLTTEELIPGGADCQIAEDGEIDFGGYTHVYWDGQETQTDELGNTLLYCRNCSNKLALVEGEVVPR